MTANSIGLPILVWLLTVDRCVHSFNLPIYGQIRLDPHTVQHQERRLTAAHSTLCLSYQNHHWSTCPLFASNPDANSFNRYGGSSDEARILQTLQQTYKQLQYNVRSEINFNFDPNSAQQSANRNLMTNNLQNPLDYNILQRLQSPLDTRINTNARRNTNSLQNPLNYNVVQSLQNPLDTRIDTNARRNTNSLQNPSDYNVVQSLQNPLDTRIDTNARRNTNSLQNPLDYNTLQRLQNPLDTRINTNARRNTNGLQNPLDYNVVQSLQNPLDIRINTNARRNTNNLQNPLDYNTLQRLQNPLDTRYNTNARRILEQPSYKHNPWDSGFDGLQFTVADIKQVPFIKHNDFLPKFGTRNNSNGNRLTTKTFNRNTRESATTFPHVSNNRVNSVTRPMMIQNIPNMNKNGIKYDTGGNRVINSFRTKYAVTPVPFNIPRNRLQTVIPIKLENNLGDISKHVGSVINTGKLINTPRTTLKSSIFTEAATTPERVIPEIQELTNLGTESLFTVPSSTSLPATVAMTVISKDITTEMTPTGVTTLLEKEAHNSAVVSPVLRVNPSTEVIANFLQTLDNFERRFYTTTFKKLSSISPADRRENGISFVESGLFLYLILAALSMEVDPKTRAEIEDMLVLPASDTEKLNMIHWTVNMLPQSTETLKFRWSSRLAVNETFGLVRTHTQAVAETLRLHLDRFSSNETSDKLMKYLNHLVEIDSGGAMRDTFEEDEISDGVRAALLSTVYVRARWRASPTLLNGTRVFRDADGAPPRTARMIRINDIMRYADMPEWDAEAVQIPYSTPGLSLLVLVPRGRSLRALSGYIAAAGLRPVINKMRSTRVATTLPIYTLRMTLLLPNKLQAMGISRLLDINNGTAPTDLRLSHAVQRLMFWAEAGRNAFKDDGIEWDDPPQLELVVDRPYIFFVRWYNFTIMTGNFVL